ncbi:MAG TPA: metallophosphoesterase [Armatimonadota bacterium]|nr:metallophosphoesterase [Armatimonadota bacterium]
MLRRSCVLVLVVLLLAAAAGPSLGWKFVSMADSRGTESANPVNTAVLSAIITLINAENVDFVIFQGDPVVGSSNDSKLSSQMDTWVALMNTLICPWYYCPGNHEIQTSNAENILRTKVDQPLNGPAGHEEMVYSFDHENAHFVSLNSNHYGEAHKVQRSWLATDLAFAMQPHIFVTAHEPAYPAGPHVGSSLDVYASERDDFWNIMSNNGVSMYFCGHEHLYARSKHGSIYQVINGTCGAPIHTGYPGTIAQHQYVVVEINGCDVQCTAKNDTGGVLDSWSYSVPPLVSISSAKALPDGTSVSLRQQVVTAGTDQFASVFYIEQPEKAAGIKVNASGKTAAYGTLVNLTGTLTTSAGERAINCSTVTTVPQPATVPDPLGMLNRAVGGGSLNEYNPGVTGGVGTFNTGLLIQVWGEVTSLDTATSRFNIDDGCTLQYGSGSPGLWVSYGDLAVGNTVNPPAVGTYAKVTGISSRRVSGSDVIAVLRIRRQQDIVYYGMSR